MTVILRNPTERNRFLKFLAVGTFGAVVDFGVANLLTHVFEMPLVLAGSISFTCAVASNFIWNRFWTYPESRTRPLVRQLGMFFAVNLAGIVIRIPILHFGEPPLLDYFQLRLFHESKTAELLSKNLTLAMAVGVVLLWNFFVNRYWTYNDVN